MGTVQEFTGFPPVLRSIIYLVLWFNYRDPFVMMLLEWIWIFPNQSLK